jgi:hypothetical protein
MGVIFFVYNAVFSTVLIIIVLVASVIAVTTKNPDTRYQPMRDDRGSFIKSQSQLNTELDALGATARGESKHGFTNSKGARIEDDDDSWSGSESNKQANAAAYGHYQEPQQQQQQPPMHSHTPSFTSNNGGNMPPTYQRSAPSPYNDHSRSGSMTSQQNRMRQAAPSPWQRGAGYD